MIEVKSVRRKETERNARNPYEEPKTDEKAKPSRMPWKVSLVLMAVAMYLKSFLPASAAEDASPEAKRPDAPGEDDGPATPAKRGMSLPEDARENADADAGDRRPEPANADATASRLRTHVQSAEAGLAANRNAPPPQPGRDLPSGLGRDLSLPTPILFPGISVPDAAEGDPAIDTDVDTDTDGDRPGPLPPRNRSPRNNGSVYLNEMASTAVLVILLQELLSRTTDPDGNLLTVRNLTCSAGRIEAVDGGVKLTLDGSHVGPLVLNYEVFDGQVAVAQTAQLTVVEAAVAGTDGADVLQGTIAAEDLDGAGGDDRIDGGDGPDILRGGDGVDVLDGGGGNDHLFGGAGDDHLSGGAGSDRLSGDAGNDHLFGGAGNDLLFGDEGDDTLDGGDGADLLAGGDGQDSLAGGAGDDMLDGGDGTDMLAGGDGQDNLDGGTGDDMLDGGTGNDALAGGDGADTLNGGDGTDTLAGGDGADALVGGDGGDVLDAGAGDDTVDGGAGDDLALADAGDDVLSGGEGQDELDSSAATLAVVFDLSSGTVTSAEFGSDTIDSFESFVGGAGDDLFLASGAAAEFTGGDGSDGFVVAAPASAADQQNLFHVSDFDAGDYVGVNQHKFFKKLADDIEDQFELVYGEKLDLGDALVRYRQDIVDDIAQTVLEIDFDRDEIFEATVTLSGSHALVLCDNG